MARRPRKAAQLPTREQILGFIKDSPSRVGKREIARAFQVGRPQRAALDRLLKDMAADGVIGRRRRRAGAPAAGLPRVAVIEISDIDVDGELLARPVNWRREGPAPHVVMAPESRGAPALGIGDRALVRLTAIGEELYEGRVIRRLVAAPDRVLGVYTRIAGSGRIVPTDKRQRREYVVGRGDEAGAVRGELVAAEVLPARHLGLPKARVVERLGAVDSPRSLSLIAIHGHAIPTTFSDEALAEADAARPVGPQGRKEFRGLPLITIDPEDARDRDDAVWAEADGSPGNEGGWHVIVAITDVAHYVRPASALDDCARERGNSVYFPDRVVPMLPEALSSGLCSLSPGEDRPVLAVEMWFDRDGKRLRHEFKRGLMRSAGALDYAQVQAAWDGKADDATRPLVAPVIRPLYGAYEALSRAREARQPLEIELPERRVVFDEAGAIAEVRPSPRLMSHRLIEDFMIAANAATAETLTRGKRPCMYRVHEPPEEEKLAALREVLGGLGYRLAKGQVLKPRHFNRVLAEAAGTAHARLVGELVLRTQSRAYYGPDRLGHFGLNLRRYAHFTSPIRRYADLLVHRALIGALGLGKGALKESEARDLTAIGEHISMTERRADAAEREAMDRFTAAYLAERVGATASGHISGVSRFGLFVTLAEVGADGLIPIATLADDYYHHDEARHCLVGRRLGKRYRLGDEVAVRVREANRITGGLRLELVEHRGPEPGRSRRRRAAA